MKLKTSVIVALFMLSMTTLFGQTNSHGDKYVFIISKINYLKAIDDAVLGASESKLQIDEVRVILCGESVKAFAEKDPLIDKALANKKIVLQACGLSLEQMKVDKSIVPDNIKIVKNGILEAMVLESKGYKKFDL